MDPESPLSNVTALLEQLSRIEKKLDDLTATTTRLESEVKSLREGYEDVRESTEHMDQHINFVNGVYDSVKAPFHRAMNMISFGGGSSPQNLPSPPRLALREPTDSE